MHIVNKDKVLWKICHLAHDYSKLHYAFTFIQTWKGKKWKKWAWQLSE